MCLAERMKKTPFPVRLHFMLLQGSPCLLHWSDDGETVLVKYECLGAVARHMGVLRQASVLQHMSDYGFRRKTHATEGKFVYSFEHPAYRRGGSYAVLVKRRWATTVGPIEHEPTAVSPCAFDVYQPPASHGEPSCVDDSDTPDPRTLEQVLDELPAITRI